MFIKAPSVKEVFEQTPEISSRYFNFGLTQRSHVNLIHDALRTVVLYNAESGFRAFAIVRRPEYTEICSQWSIKLLGIGEALGKQLRSLAVGSSITIEDKKYILVAADGGNIPSVEVCNNMLILIACKEALKSTETNLAVLRHKELLKMFRHVQAHRDIAKSYWLSVVRTVGTAALATEHYKRPTISVINRLEKLVACGLLRIDEKPMSFSEYTAEGAPAFQRAELSQWRKYTGSCVTNARAW